MIVGPTGMRMSKSTRLLYMVTFGSSSHAHHDDESRTVPSRCRLMLMPSSDSVWPSGRMRRKENNQRTTLQQSVGGEFKRCEKNTEEELVKGDQ